MSEPKKGVAYTFGIVLEDSSSPGDLKANPTISAGDFKASIDGAAFANLTNLPTVTPAGGVRVEITLSSTEMNSDDILIKAEDPDGEWETVSISIQTVLNTQGEIYSKVSSLSYDGNGSVKSVQQFPTGAIVADGGNSVIQFKSNKAETVNDYWRGFAQMTSGLLVGQYARILSYNGTTKIFVLSSSFTGVPAPGDTFKIINE